MTEEGYLKQEPGLFTNAIHGGFDPEQEASRPLVPSISMTTAFEQDGPGQFREFLYSPFGNPTRQVLEKTLAAIDNAEFAMCFSSGLAATTAITTLLRPGDHIIAGNELYGGTNKLFREVFVQMNIHTTFVDTLDPKNVEDAMKENTKLVWLESPTNPLLKITDIAKVAEIVHSKRKDAILAVDNTFLTPYFQRPLNLGADLSMNSTSKYINGHIDVIMGCVTTNNENLYNRLTFLRQAMGIVPSPFDCYQVIRSLKSFPLRMEKHMKSGIIVAKYLETQSQVERVIHPGLPSHPQHALVKKQCYGTSGMVSFYIKGGSLETNLFVKSLKMIKYAGSLGGYSTTVCVPAYMSHVGMPAEQRAQLGITDNLVRMTVGLESTDDIIADIAQAFKSL